MAQPVTIQTRHQQRYVDDIIVAEVHGPHPSKLDPHLDKTLQMLVTFWYLVAVQCPPWRIYPKIGPGSKPSNHPYHHAKNFWDGSNSAGN